MKETKWTAFLVLCLILSLENFNNILFATNPERDSVIIKKCQDFKITGDGASAAWNKTEWITLFQQEPKATSYQTKVKVLYSEMGIYFLFNCEDKKLTSTMKADNLNLWEEDCVEVFLWTDENFPVYFEYELSPFNFELPIMVPNNKGNFLGWLPWHYEGERKTQHATTVKGGSMESGKPISEWTAEFFIPYKLLAPLSNVPPEAGTRWRVNMYRLDYDNGEAAYSWQKTSKTFHEYNKFGTFIFK
jgi:Carbohydrate family 9 binding domain-like